MGCAISPALMKKELRVSATWLGFVTVMLFMDNLIWTGGCSGAVFALIIAQLVLGLFLEVEMMWSL
jgi:hypothetical protein